MLDACCSLAYERIILPLSVGFETKFAQHVAFQTIGQSILKLFMRLVAKFWARNALTLLDFMFRQIKKLTNKLGKLNLNQWVRLAS